MATPMESFFRTFRTAQRRVERRRSCGLYAPLFCWPDQLGLSWSGAADLQHAILKRKDLFKTSAAPRRISRHSRKPFSTIATASSARSGIGALRGRRRPWSNLRRLPATSSSGPRTVGRLLRIFRTPISWRNLCRSGLPAQVPEMASISERVSPDQSPSTQLRQRGEEEQQRCPRPDPNAQQDLCARTHRSRRRSILSMSVNAICEPGLESSS
jgi:hypothetical protein